METLILNKVWRPFGLSHNPLFRPNNVSL